MVVAIAFGASQTGVAIADDLATGMIDRFRSLPMARSAVLFGRTVADAVRNRFVIALMTAVGYAVGFRVHAGVPAALAAAGLALAVGVAFSWINALIGLLVRDAESAGLAGLLAVIPLIFTSSTFVPVATMPGWLQAFAKVNPVTVSSTRSARCAWAARPPGRSGTRWPGSRDCSPSPCRWPWPGTGGSPDTGFRSGRPTGWTGRPA